MMHVSRSVKLLKNAKIHASSNTVKKLKTSEQQYTNTKLAKIVLIALRVLWYLKTSKLFALRSYNISKIQLEVENRREIIILRIIESIKLIGNRGHSFRQNGNSKAAYSLFNRVC